MAEATAVTPPPTAKPNRFSGLGQRILVPILAVFTALVIGGLIILISGGNPLEAYKGLLEGAFGSPKAISETFIWATPYIFAGLAVALAFKGGLFNIGAEGQLALGALTAAWLGYGLPKVLGTTIPAVIHVPICIIGGAVAGGLWGAIPGWLKARFGAHEVINTIMMNYIALGLVSFMLNGPMKDPSPTNVIARTPQIATTARISPIFAGSLDPVLSTLRVHWGTVLAFIVAFLVWFLLWKMTTGFEIRTVGTSNGAARYAGINVGRTIILTMFLSGALAGLAGAIEVTGLNYRHELSFALGYGFDAIAIALLGRTHPFGVVLAAFLFGAMRSGATRMQFLTQIPVDIISVVQALILLFIAADEIIRYMYRIRAPKEEVIMTRGWGG
jgi:ABC-type uncharacterized transport system permease subunit